MSKVDIVREAAIEFVRSVNFTLNGNPGEDATRPRVYNPFDDETVRRRFDDLVDALRDDGATLLSGPGKFSAFKERPSEPTIDRLRAAVKAWQEWHKKATSPGPSPSFAPVLKAMKDLEEGTR